MNPALLHRASTRPAAARTQRATRANAVGWTCMSLFPWQAGGRATPRHSCLPPPPLPPTAHTAAGRARAHNEHLTTVCQTHHHVDTMTKQDLRDILQQQPKHTCASNPWRTQPSHKAAVSQPSCEGPATAHRSVLSQRCLLERRPRIHNEHHAQNGMT